MNTLQKTRCSRDLLSQASVLAILPVEHVQPESVLKIGRELKRSSICSFYNGSAPLFEGGGESEKHSYRIVLLGAAPSSRSVP